MKFEMRNLITRFEHLVEGARLKYSRASCLHYEILRNGCLFDEPVFGGGEVFAAFFVEGGSGDLEGAEFFDLGKHAGGAGGVFDGEVSCFAQVVFEIIEFEGEGVRVEGVATNDEFPGAEVEG